MSLPSAHLGGDVRDRLLQAAVGLLVELGDADIADVVAFDLRLHRCTWMTSRVSVTSNGFSWPLRMIVSVILVFAGPRILLDRLVQRHALDLLAVDG